MRDGWIETTLGEICKDGLFADGDWVESKDQDPEGDYRLLQLADIGDGAFLDKSDRWMNKEQFQRLGCTKLEVNDVLIARMPDPIGRACLLPEGLPSSATVVDVAIVRTGNEILQRMLSLIVNSPEFRNEALSLLTGTTRQRISRGNLSKISFWLPTLPEQKRIVDLISSVDSYIEALQQQLESGKRSRNAVLHELLNASGDDWVEHKLIDMFEIYQPQTIAKSLMSDDGEFIVFGANGPIGRYHEFNHDEPEVVVTCRGATCGTVNMTPPKTWITGNAMVVSPKTSEVLKEFLYWALVAGVDIQSVISGSAQPQITREGLAPVKIKIPPLSIQKEIVDLINGFELSISNSEETLNKAKSLRSGLLSDLLSGEHEIPVTYDKVMGAA